MLERPEFITHSQRLRFDLMFLVVESRSLLRARIHVAEQILKGLVDGIRSEFLLLLLGFSRYFNRLVLRSTRWFGPDHGAGVRS